MPGHSGRSSAQFGSSPGWNSPIRLILSSFVLLLTVAPLSLWADPGPAASAASAGQDAVAYQMTIGHTGYSMDPVGPTWAKGWSFTLNGLPSYPLIADGEVFVVSYTSSPILYAFNASTGSLVWQQSVGAGPTGITYASGRVFEQSTNVMSAYDALTGSLDWSSLLPTQWLFDSAPTAADGSVFSDGAGDSGTVYAFAQSTGALEWTAFAENGMNSSPAVGPHALYESYGCDLTQAYDPTSGTEIWGYYDGCEGGGGQTAVVANDTVYLRDLTLDATTGAVTGALAAGPAPAVDGSNLYVERAGTLRAQTLSGAVLWSFGGDGQLDTSPIVDHGVVYEGSQSGTLYGLSAETGQQLWSTNLGKQIGALNGDPGDSATGLAEGDGLLAVPAGDTLTVFEDSAAPPSPPTGVGVSESGSQAVLHWTVPPANGSAITAFTILPTVDGVAQTPIVVPAGAVGSPLDPTPGAVDSYTVTGLTPTSANILSVGADNGGGQGPSTTANTAPLFTSSDATTLVQGAAGSFTVQSYGSPTPSLTETGQLPSGVTFTDNGDGSATLAGTPATGTSGTYPLTLTAHSPVATSTQTFSLTVGVPPHITTTPGTTFTVGSSGSFQFASSGFPAPSYSENGVLPSGVTLSTTGALTGTPATGAGGEYPILVTASNGVAPSAQQPFLLTVDGPPTVTSADATTFVQGSPASFTVTTAGLPAPSLSATGALPLGVSFVDNGNGTATLSGVSAVGTMGQYPLTIAASNGIGPAVDQSFVLTVDEPPVFTSPLATTFTVGSPSSFSATATGFPAVTSYREVGPLPAGVTFSSAGTLSGIPGPGSSGVYPITLTASNGVSPSATQSFVLVVDGPPTLTSSDTTTFVQGAAGNFTVRTAGVPAPALSETGTLPIGVTFTDNGDGTASLAGTPQPGTYGSYPITIDASNGIGSPASQSFVLTVDAPPVFTSPPSATFDVGSPSSFQAAATGYPAVSYTETGSLPTGVTFGSNGTLSGTPAAGTSRAYPITLTASNGVSPTASQSFVLTVDGPPAITTGNTTTFVQGVVGDFTVRTSGLPIPSLSETGTLPTGVTFIDNGDGTASLAGTPQSGTDGSYPITIDASNGFGSPASQSFVLVVGTPATITSAASTTFTAGSAGSFQFSASGFPSPNYSELGTLPAGVTLSFAGTLAGTPAPGGAGTYPITVVAANGVPPSAIQQFTVTVDAPPAINSPASTSMEPGTPGSFTVTTSGYPTATLSETGGLPSGVTFTDNGDGTATLGGTPAGGSDGTYPLTITAQNGIATPATQSFTLVVGEPPTITSAAGTSFTVGSPGNFTVTATGSPAPTFSESGPLPSGVDLSTAGALTGTPGNGTAGTYPITITASNGMSPSDSQSFVLTVDNPSSITTPGAPTGLSATLGNTGATINWSPPSDDGGDPITYYTLTGENTTTSTSLTPVVVSGSPPATSGTFVSLTPGDGYSFAVTAANAIGTGPSSTVLTEILPAPFFPVAPARICDTRSDTSNQCTAKALASGGTLTVQVTGNGGVPSGATAVVANVTVTGASASSYLTAYAAGTTRPGVSNLDFTAGRTVSNLVTVPLSSSGAIDLFNAAGSTNVIVDVTGYYGPGSGQGFAALAPARICDTRSGTANQCTAKALASGGTLTVQVTGNGGVPSGATAVVANVTVTGATASSYLTAYAAGTSRPVASNLDFTAGETATNRVILPLSSTGALALFNAAGSTNAIVDVTGYFSGSSPGYFEAVSPTRICDTRAANATPCSGKTLGAGSILGVQVTGEGGVQSGAAAVVANVTATGTTAPSYLTVYPAGTTRPVASDLNWTSGETVSNLVVGELSQTGDLNVFNASGSANVLVDVAGWYT